jgi:1-aminocyclopropane-1-carboxylate deaminase
MHILAVTYLHFGGYAKATEELINFVKEFNRNNEFAIEPVYTGKAMFALNNYLISNQELMKNKKVLFVHTGGLHSF